MKRQADKGRSERVFQVGDRVYLKLQPYVQSSLAPRANQKLSFKFFGPYSVVERIGSSSVSARPSGVSCVPVEASYWQPTGVIFIAFYLSITGYS